MQATIILSRCQSYTFSLWECEGLNIYGLWPRPLGAPSIYTIYDTRPLGAPGAPSLYAIHNKVPLFLKASCPYKDG